MVLEKKATSLEPLHIFFLVAREMTKDNAPPLKFFFPFVNYFRDSPSPLQTWKNANAIRSILGNSSYFKQVWFKHLNPYLPRDVFLFFIVIRDIYFYFLIFTWNLIGVS